MDLTKLVTSIDAGTWAAIWNLLSAAGLGLALFFARKFVKKYKKEGTELKESVDLLKQLEAIVNSLQASKDAENAIHVMETARLMARIGQVEEKNAACDAKYTELEGNYNKLKNDYKSLDKKYKDLDAKYNDLAARYDASQAEVTVLRRGRTSKKTTGELNANHPR